MPQNQFEIPQELRQLAEENVERARQLYLQFMGGVEQTMSAWSAAGSDAIMPGFIEVRERAAKFADENANAAFKLAKEVANAKDLQELLSLQSRYVQSQMQWYADQTQEFGKLMAKALTQSQQQPKPHYTGVKAPTASHKPDA
jgi:phasin